MTEATISVVDAKALLSLFGARDQHLRKIRDALAVDISARDDQIRIQGSDNAVACATEVLEQLKALVHRQGSLEADQVSHILSDLAGQTPGAAPAIEVLNAGPRSCPARPDKPAT